MKAGKERKVPIHRTKDEKIEVVKTILDLYSTGLYTIDSCCQNNGVTVRAFTNWKEECSEIADLYKKTQLEVSAAHKRELRVAAESSLLKKVKGFEVEETEIKGTLLPNGEISGKQVRKTKKYFAPDTTAIIFALTNTNNENDPEFVNNYRQDVTGKIEIPAIDNLPDDLIQALIKHTSK